MKRDWTRIGGSDVAAICGFSKFSSPIKPWCRLTGQDVPSDFSLEDNRPAFWGIENEPQIARSWFAQHIPGQAFCRGVIYNHPQKRYCISPDAVNSVEIPSVYLEVKNLAWFREYDFGEPGSDQVDMEYYAQCQWGIYILNEWLTMNAKGAAHIEAAHMRVLFGGNNDKDFVIPYNPAFLSKILAVIEHFLEHNVAKNIPPDPDESDEYREFLLKEFDFPFKGDKTRIPASEEIETNVATYIDAKDRMNAAEVELKKAQNEICAFIGSAYGMSSKHGNFNWNPMKGKVSNSKVIVEIQQRYSIVDEELNDIKERSRGEETRAFRFYPGKKKRTI